MEVTKSENEDSNPQSFEFLKYDISRESEDILSDNSCDPDLNFFEDSIKNLDTKYILPGEFKDFLSLQLETCTGILLSALKDFSNVLEKIESLPSI